jgi:hypothetical protein
MIGLFYYKKSFDTHEISKYMLKQLCLLDDTAAIHMTIQPFLLVYTKIYYNINGKDC